MFSCPADSGGIPDSYFLEKVYRAHGTSYQTNIFLVGADSCKPFSDRTEQLDLAIAARLPNLNITRVSGHARLVLIGDYGWVNQWDLQGRADRKRGSGLEQRRRPRNRDN